MGAVDLAKFSSDTAGYVTDAKNEFLGKLSTLQSSSYLSSASFLRDFLSSKLKDIGDVTFKNYDDIAGILRNIGYTPLPQNTDITKSNASKAKTHVFDSRYLDHAEDAILKYCKESVQELYNQDKTGISASAYTALTQIQNDVDLANKAVFLQLLPLGLSTQSNKDWLSTRADYKKEDRKRTTYIAMIELAQKQVQWAFLKATDVEALHARFTIGYNNTFATLQQTALEIYKAEVSANLLNFENNVKKQDLKLEQEMLSIDIYSSDYDLKLKQSEAILSTYVQEYSSALNINTQNLDTYINNLKNVADGYKSIFTGYASQFSGISLDTKG